MCTAGTLWFCFSTCLVFALFIISCISFDDSSSVYACLGLRIRGRIFIVTIVKLRELVLGCLMCCVVLLVSRCFR